MIESKKFKGVNIYKIELFSLFWMVIPITIVIFYYYKFTKDIKTSLLALIRMVIQLLLIGYFLLYIFNANSSILIIGVLFIMLFFASIISLRPLKNKNKRLYFYSFISILIGGGVTLAIVIFKIIKPISWYEPRVIIPLAGMIFANAMNVISLFVDRYFDEFDIAKSFKASLIPIINSFFAVGLVSLPGMMTGQILSGVDVLIAIRYQILVMLMVLSGSGLSVVIFIHFLKKD